MEAATNVQSLLSLSAPRITAGFFKHYVWFLAFQSFWTTRIARSKNSAHRHRLVSTDFMQQPRSMEWKQDATVHDTAECCSPHHTSAECDSCSLPLHKKVYSFFNAQRGRITEWLGWKGPRGSSSYNPPATGRAANNYRRRFFHAKKKTKKNQLYSSKRIFCCVITIILFTFTTFTLFHEKYTT